MKAGIYIYNDGKTGESAGSHVFKNFQDQKEKMLKEYLDNESELNNLKLEKKYNEIIFGKKNVKNLESPFIELWKNTVAEAINNQLKKAVADADIVIESENPFSIGDANAEGFDAAKRNALKNSIDKSINYFDQEDKKRILVASLEKTRDDLIKVVDDLQRRNAKGYKSYNEAELYLSKMDNNFNSVKEKIIFTVDSILSVENSRSQTGKSIYINAIKNTTAYEDLLELIDIFGNIPKAPADSTYTGHGGEYLVKLVDFIGSNNLKDVVGELTINDIPIEIIGKSKGSTTKEMKKNKKNNWSSFSYNVEEGNYSLSVSSRNISKVDVDITITNKNGIGRKVGASVKNYGNYNSANIVDNTPLSNVLNYIDSTKYFAGHYANLIAWDNMIQGNSYFTDDVIRAWRDQCEDYIITASIISGFLGYAKETPEIFIAIDNTNSIIKVFNMKALIKEVIENKRANSFIEKQKQILSGLSVSFSGNFGKMTLDANNIFRRHKINLHVNLASLMEEK